MTVKESFVESGLMIVNDLRNALAAANRNASGKTSDSIEFQVYEDSEKLTFQVLANKSIRALQEGRGPTQKSGDGSVKHEIRQWIKDKGISSDPSESMVFLITRKIHQEGYKGTPGLIDNVISEQLIDNITNRVSEVAGNEFVKELVWD